MSTAVSTAVVPSHYTGTGAQSGRDLHASAGVKLAELCLECLLGHPAVWLQQLLCRQPGLAALLAATGGSRGGYEGSAPAGKQSGCPLDLDTLSQHLMIYDGRTYLLEQRETSVRSQKGSRLRKGPRERVLGQP